MQNIEAGQKLILRNFPRQALKSMQHCSGHPCWHPKIPNHGNHQPGISAELARLHCKQSTHAFSILNATNSE